MADILRISFTFTFEKRKIATTTMKEKKEKKEKKSKISKEVLNVIRTTQRNNIELTNIADNKANMLLSLNRV